MLPGTVSRRFATIALVCIITSVGAVAMPGCGKRGGKGRAPDVRITRVQIEGNQGIGAQALRKGLATEERRRKGGEFQPFLVQRDIERIRTYYQRRGYFAVAVRSQVARQEILGQKTARVTFSVQEGPRTRVGSITVLGVPEGDRVTEGALRARLKIAEGQYFDYSAYSKGKGRMKSTLVRSGYAYAQVRGVVAINRRAGQIDIAYRIDPGPLVRFGHTEVRGLARVPLEVVMARLAWKEGDVYQPSRLETTRSRLYQLGWFANVRVELSLAEHSATPDVLISVTESKPREFRFGVGLGIDPVQYSLRSRTSHSWYGMPTDKSNLRLEARPAAAFVRDDSIDPDPVVEASAQLERIDFLRPFVRGDLLMAYSVETYDAYSTVGPRFRAGINTPLFDNRVQVGLGWQLRLLSMCNLDPAIEEDERIRLGIEEDDGCFHLVGPFRVGAFDQSIALDRRDNPIDAQSGYYLELRLEEGSTIAGGGFTYLKMTPDARVYVTAANVTLALRARFGGILGDLPVTQRYFSGGASRNRGFPERRLSPVATSVIDNGDGTTTNREAHVGGGALLETSAELRIPITKLFGLPLGTVLFVDGADVTETIGELAPSNLHWAAGAGLRVGTPIGPIRFDVGYRLTRTGVGELRAGQRLVYHFSLGQAF